MLAAEGGTTVKVTGSGFTGPALCRIDAPVTGTTQLINATTAAFAAVDVSGTCLTCPGAPAVVAPGPAVLRLSFDAGKTWSSASSVGAEVAYVELVEVAVGRRPYVAEKAGELLLKSHSSLDGVALSVSASLPAMNASWQWHAVPGGEDVVLKLDFSSLGPPNKAVHNDLLVEISGGFFRANGPPPSPSLRTLSPLRCLAER